MFTKEKESLIKVENVLADGGYTGEKFAAAVQELLAQLLKLPSEVSYINLLLFQNDGLLNVLSLG